MDTSMPPLKHHKTLDETKIKKQKTQPKTGKSSGEK